MIDKKQYDKLFNSEIVRNNLILSSLYLTAYELLNSSIIDRIKTFYLDGIKNGEITYSSEYNSKVLKRKIKGKENIFLSSCLWLIEHEIITESDFADIKEIKRHRNDIAHRIHDIITNIEKEINLNHLLKIHQLLRKIENWWILEFEVPINPDFDNVDIEEDSVTSGRELLLNHLISIAFEEKKSKNNHK